MRRRRAAPPPRVSLLVEGEGEWGEFDAGVEVEVVRIEADGAASEVERLSRGLEQAGTELAVRLRPGEALLPGALSRLANALRVEPAAAAAYPAYLLLGGTGGPAETIVPEELDLDQILRFQHFPAGTGAMFRRQPALVAARFGASERFGELAFWLKLATAGPLRRIAEPLASSATRPSFHPGGLDAARDRLAMLRRVLDELSLPTDFERAVVSAGRSACVLAAAELEDGFNGPGERVCAVDRLGLLPTPPDSGLDAEVATLEAQVADLERDAGRQRVAVSVLESAVEERRAEE